LKRDTTRQNSSRTLPLASRSISSARRR
jgi:hypothetical protein